MTAKSNSTNKNTTNNNRNKTLALAPRCVTIAIILSLAILSMRNSQKMLPTTVLASLGEMERQWSTNTNRTGRTTGTGTSGTGTSDTSSNRSIAIITTPTTPTTTTTTTNPAFLVEPHVIPTLKIKNTRDDASIGAAQDLQSSNELLLSPPPPHQEEVEVDNQPVQMGLLTLNASVSKDITTTTTTTITTTNTTTTTTTTTPPSNQNNTRTGFSSVFLADNGQVQEPIDVFFNSPAFHEKYPWLKEYIDWHAEQRRLFPDASLLQLQQQQQQLTTTTTTTVNNSSSNQNNNNNNNNNNNKRKKVDAPRIVIAYLDEESKGGLHDRMFSIGLCIYRAHLSKRILLLKWYNAPTEQLEDFLVPNLFNWTVPHHPTVATSRALKAHYPQWESVKLEKEHANSNFDANDDARQHISIVSIKGAFDEIDNNNDDVPFGVFWHAYFLPSPLVQQELDGIFETNGLVAGHYSAIHCRVKHPAHYDKIYHVNMDKYGTEMSSKEVSDSLQTAVRAIQCSNSLSTSTTSSSRSSNNNNTSTNTNTNNNTTINENNFEPAYFYSDSEDLVQAVVGTTDFLSEEVNGTISTTTPSSSSSVTVSEKLAELRQLAKRSKIVGRLSDVDNVNLAVRNKNNKKSNSIESYTGTFLDVYMGANARCVTLGVGRYAYLATQISGTKCRIRHENPRRKAVNQWGMKDMVKAVPNCHVPK